MHKVIIVAEEQFIQLHLAKLLTSHDCEVMATTDGVPTLQTCDTTKPETAFLEKNGLEALNDIRGFDPEAKDYAIKSLNPDRVMTALQKVLG